MAVYNAPTSVIDAIDRRGSAYETGLGGANTSKLGSFLEGLSSGAVTAANVGASIVSTQAVAAQTAAEYNPERLASEQLKRELENRKLKKATELSEEFGTQEEQLGIDSAIINNQYKGALTTGQQQKNELFGQIGLADAQSEIDLRRAQAYHLRNPGMSASQTAAQAKEDARRRMEEQRQEFLGSDSEGVPTLAPSEQALSPQAQELHDAGKQYESVASQFQHAQQKGQILQQTNATNIKAKAQQFANKIQAKGVDLTDIISITGNDMLQAAGDLDLTTQQPNYANGLENLLMLDQTRQVATSEEQRALASATIAQGLKAFPNADAFIESIDANPDKTPEEKNADKRAFYKAVYAGDKTNLPKQQKSLADAGFAPENVADTPQTYDRIGLGIANEWDSFDDPDLKRVIRTDPYVAAASTASKNGQQPFSSKMELMQNNNPGDIAGGNGPSYQMIFRGADGTAAPAPLPTTPEGHAMLSVLDVVSKNQKANLQAANKTTGQIAGIEERNQQLAPPAAQPSIGQAGNFTSPAGGSTGAAIDIANTPQQVAEADVVTAQGAGAPVQQPQQNAEPAPQKSSNFIDNRQPKKQFSSVTIKEDPILDQDFIDDRARYHADRQVVFDEDKATKLAEKEQKRRDDSFKPLTDAETKERIELESAKNYNKDVQNALNIVRDSKLESVFGPGGAVERGVLETESYLPFGSAPKKAENYAKAKAAFGKVRQEEIQRAAKISGPRSIDSPTEAANMAQLAVGMKPSYEMAVLLDAMNQNKESWIENGLDLSSILKTRGVIPSGDKSSTKYTIKNNRVDSKIVQQLKSAYRNDKTSAKYIVAPDGVTVTQNPDYQDADTWLKAHTNYEGAQTAPPASSGGAPPTSGGNFPAASPSVAESKQDFSKDPNFRRDVDAYKSVTDPSLIQNIAVGIVPGFIRRPIREAGQSLGNTVKDLLSNPTLRDIAVREQAQKEHNQEQDKSYGHMIGEVIQMAKLIQIGEGAVGAAAKGTGAVSKIAQGAEKILKTTTKGESLLTRSAARLAKGLTLDNAVITAVESGEGNQDQAEVWSRFFGSNAVIGGIGATIIGPFAGAALTQLGDTAAGRAVRVMLGSREAALDSLGKKLADKGVDLPGWAERAKKNPIEALGELKGAARDVVEDIVTNPKSQKFLNSKVAGTDKTVKQILSEQNTQYAQQAAEESGIAGAPSVEAVNKEFSHNVEGVRQQTEAATTSKIRTTQAAEELLAQRDLYTKLAKARNVFEKNANTDLQGAINNFGKAVGAPVDNLPTVAEPLPKDATAKQVEGVVKNYRDIATQVGDVKRSLYQKSSSLLDNQTAMNEGPQIMEELMGKLRTDPQGNPETADSMVKYVLSKADNETLGPALSRNRADIANKKRLPSNAGLQAPMVQDSELPVTVGFLNEMRQAAISGVQSEGASFSANSRAVELIDEAANKLTNGQWSGFTEAYKPLTESITKLNKSADYIDEIRVAMQEAPAVITIGSRFGERGAKPQGNIEDIVGTEGRAKVLKAAKGASDTQSYLNNLRKEMENPIPNDKLVAEYSNGLKEALKLSNSAKLDLGDTILKSPTTDYVDTIKSGIGENGDKVIKDAIRRAVDNRIKVLESASAQAPNVGESAARALGFSDDEVKVIKHVLGVNAKNDALIDRYFNETINSNSYRNFLEGYDSGAAQQGAIPASAPRHLVYSGAKFVLDIVSAVGNKLYGNKAAAEATKLLFNPDPATSTAAITSIAKKLAGSAGMEGYTAKEIKALLIDGIARNAYYTSNALMEENSEAAHKRAIQAENASKVLDNLKADKKAIRQ